MLISEIIYLVLGNVLHAENTGQKHATSKFGKRGLCRKTKLYALGTVSWKLLAALFDQTESNQTKPTKQDKTRQH